MELLLFFPLPGTVTNKSNDQMAENPVFERATRFLSALRHCQVLGLKVHSASSEGLTVVLPYSAQIVGNPLTGVVHGGAITSLMDTACGMATLCVLPEFEVCPTLDLRIDYMHAAEPHKDVYGFAQCYRVTTDVIFARGFAYQDDPEQPIAHVVGTFMRMGKGLKGTKGFGGAIKGENP
ncbi:PaaI family thioesterase [Bacillus subtilis]|nr:PaaI family thioesterase [Bacillus subtilis]